MKMPISEVVDRDSVVPTVKAQNFEFTQLAITFLICFYGLFFVRKLLLVSHVLPMVRKIVIPLGTPCTTVLY